MTPDEWATRLSACSELSSEACPWTTASVRHWRGGSAELEQPALDHHYIVRHLGGHKRVERRRDGVAVSAVVDCGAITIVPAGTQFTWCTQGPVEFAHIYIRPALFEGLAARFDRQQNLDLIDRVGCRDPLLECLHEAILAEVRLASRASELYLDELLETLMLRLLRAHSSMSAVRIASREALPAFRLRRVLAFIDAHLGDAISLSDLAKVAGGSVFHFSRAFRNAAGAAPYRYLQQRRLVRAKALLETSELSISQIARACGFQDTAYFSRAFSRSVGIPATRYRGRVTTGA